MIESSAGKSPATILIVDDTPANLGVVVESLEDYGFRVLVAQDGEEGLRRAEFALPDLILLDIMMPGLDGLEVCRRLKAKPATQAIPVIFMTALADTDSKVAGFAAGGVDYVTKPLEIAEVLWRIQAQLALRNMQNQLLAQNALLQKEVAERQQAQSALEETCRRLAESEERYRLLVELSADAILIEADGAVAYANPAALRLFGAGRADELAGRPVLSLVAPPSRLDAAQAICSLQPGGEPSRRDEMAQRLDGGTLEVAVTRTAFIYRGKPASEMVVRDISEHKRFASELRHQATHDALTGLPNRTLLMDRLRRAITLARRHEERFLVGFVDLDRFKWINDTLGHEAGDELLRIVSDRMSACLRETDTLARLGGDEFVLLLQDAGGVSAALQIMSRVVAAASRPLDLCGRRVAVTCSVGCSTYPEDGQSAEELLKSADAAMYRAKEAGRNNLQIYSAELRRRIDERVELETELRRAVDGNGLGLRYEPQVDLRSGALVGLEAQLQWQHPRLGKIEPARILALAEDCGLVDGLGSWLLRKVCEQGKAWRDAGLPPVRLSISFFARQFHWPGLESLLARCLADTGFAPAGLELALAEGASMQEPERSTELMQRLKAQGIGLALDNFGTGYSSMHYLKRLPIDRLKLDGSFVAEITRDPDNLAIADAIISMAHRLGQKVVADRVESEGQLRLLAARGCDHGQGPYFGQPLAAVQCAGLLDRGVLALPPANDERDAARTLLILDDEVHVTAALRRILRLDGYRLLVAHRADEAFELLASHRVGVIISDQRMPETTGVEFLSRAKRLYPRTVRLMLSGHRDFEAVTAAINRGAIHKFMLKPWDNDELRQVVAEAFELYERQAGEADGA